MLVDQPELRRPSTEGFNVMKKLREHQKVRLVRKSIEGNTPNKRRRKYVPPGLGASPKCRIRYIVR